MEGQPQEKMIHELSGEELVAAISAGEERLKGLFTEIEQNPDENARDTAKQAAYDQFDALIRLYEELGEEKRVLSGALHRRDNNAPDEDRFRGEEGDANMIPAYLRRENEGR